MEKVKIKYNKTSRRFNKGDKVVLSETAFRENEGSLWISEVCEFLGKNKFLTVEGTSSSSSHYSIEEFPQYIFNESWLEPYEQKPIFKTKPIEDILPIRPSPVVMMPGEETISMRDYFAMSAMNGVLSNYADSIQRDRLEALGVMAYQIADAMLKAREQKDE